MHLHVPHHIDPGLSLIGMALGVIAIPVMVLMTLFLIAR